MGLIDFTFVGTVPIANEIIKDYIIPILSPVLTFGGAFWLFKNEQENASKRWLNDVYAKKEAELLINLRSALIKKKHYIIPDTITQSTFEPEQDEITNDNTAEKIRNYNIKRYFISKDFKAIEELLDNYRSILVILEELEPFIIKDKENDLFISFHNIIVNLSNFYILYLESKKQTRKELCTEGKAEHEHKVGWEEDYYKKEITMKRAECDQLINFIVVNFNSMRYSFSRFEKCLNNRMTSFKGISGS